MPGRRSNNFKNDSKHQNWKRTWSWWDELSRRFIRNYYFTRFSRASCFAVLSGPAFVASHFYIIKSCLHGWRDISRRGRVAGGEFYSFSFRPPFVPFEGIKASQPSICSYIYIVLTNRNNYYEGRGAVVVRICRGLNASCPFSARKYGFFCLLDTDRRIIRGPG